MPDSVALSAFDLVAPTREWDEVVNLFVACFSVEPYLEDPLALRSIATWGPTMLAGNGRLVTARVDGALAGFASGHNLDAIPSWQRTLLRLEGVESATSAVMDPLNAFVVHELAVRESERGRGIAARCMCNLLNERDEARVFLGTYERAVKARALYEKWGFEVLGRVSMDGDAAALHVMTSSKVDAVNRIGASISA
ncbi:GNAT family N-acetyltransferase [Microbacterium trichothecenolyticum]|uniref:Ribosomal protein S18 acetylase RimI-like enzyme n=1 Tax=Microbacterium trichothecenolyticum TaxID=69370 RepID=A0ABU0TT73_MICTR|nr:GNAT family N-acetyltransferase [Microbacterium trichothecenolyticum]MDQ1122858.1 ribosomal protein S18 acetylase RimI-like enzyme [Microbacterium trichothecenolyticum]